MKKVCFIRRQHNPFGGVERYFERLVVEMKRRENFDVEILHITQPGWMPSWIKLPYYDFQVCRKRKKECIYFSNDRLSCLDIHRAGGGTHKTFLKVKGFTLNPLHPVYLWLEKRTLQNSRQIIAISEMVKRNIIDDYGIDEKKITVVYNGIDLEEISQKEMDRRKEKVLKEFGIERNLPLILYVGSGYERKGVWEFLEILSRLHSPFHAFVVGKEKNLQKYIRRADALGIAEHVTFAGPRRDVENFYCASDIFLFPTRYEPFGSVVLEAMHYGNAVITTRQCGAGEILEMEPLMQTSEDFNIAAFIEELLQNPSRLEKIKSRNRSLAENYSMKRNVDETLAVIEKVTD
ncbi:glycosyltransferase family 4 protein [Hydrogenimonas sp. SS33]|uniref:glycosyltransferase family 4 protein n=1 Tax=Hydrogenimonas leucolamina TaxID=2954236 RepID=UPI00336C1DB1